jgi:hypothetical protein
MLAGDSRRLNTKEKNRYMEKAKWRWRLKLEGCGNELRNAREAIRSWNRQSGHCSRAPGGIKALPDFWCLVSNLLLLYKVICNRSHRKLIHYHPCAMVFRTYIFFLSQWQSIALMRILPKVSWGQIWKIEWVIQLTNHNVIWSITVALKS